MHVHWHEGLFLQPHHLQWMQRNLQADLRATRSLLHPLGYGVIESELAQDRLAAGRILFNRLRVIMPRGEEVCFPDDAELPELDLTKKLPKDGGSHEIMLVVPLWAAHRPNAFDLGQNPDSGVKKLFIPREKREVADENTGDNRQTMHLRKINARLAVKGENLDDTDNLVLLRVLRPASDTAQARLDPEFSPACVYLKSDPMLYNTARDLLDFVSNARGALQLKLAGGGFAIEEKWTRVMRLTALNRVCGCLPALIEDGTVPPQIVYLQFRELLGELAALNEGEDLFKCREYTHSDPLPAFKELDQRIRRATVDEPNGKKPLKVKVPMVRPGLCRTPPGGTDEGLDKRHFEEPNGYLLGIETRVDITTLAPFVTDGNKFKLMPSSAELQARFGIELQRVAVAPINLPGGAHYFRLAPASNPSRWEQIKAEKAISLVWNNLALDLSDASFTLWMTLP